MANIKLTLELPPTFQDRFVAAWNIVDPDLQVVARGSFLDRHSDEVSLSAGKYWARIELPNNQSESRPFVVAPEVARIDLKFTVPSPSAREWLGWASVSEAPSVVAERERVPALADLWAASWSLDDDGTWVQTPDADEARLRREGGLLQLELSPFRDRICALQLGGSIASRFLILPPQGVTRVLISTPFPYVESTGSSRPDVEVSVSLANSLADHLARFLSAGSPSAWDALESKLLRGEGTELFLGKRNDPLGAAVAGYLLTQVSTSPPPLDWLRNLADLTPWLADGPILYAHAVLKSGQRSALYECTKYLSKAAERGYPIFARGVDLFLDTLRLLRSSKVEVSSVIEEWANLFARVRANSTRQTAFTSFYGELPSAPRGFEASIEGANGPASARPHRNVRRM